jgi:hypothetical protein
MNRSAAAVLMAGIAALAGCAGRPVDQHTADGPVHQQAADGPVYQQAVPGTFMREGGPAPGSPVPLPGTITAHGVTGQTFTATAGPNGRFTLSLPPGSYDVTGRSPLMQSGQAACPAAAELRVTRGKPASPVTVVCIVP